LLFARLATRQTGLGNHIGWIIKKIRPLNTSLYDTNDKWRHHANNITFIGTLITNVNNILMGRGTYIQHTT